MSTAKRAYKLQEFVAHSSSVNCLKIGRKTSRVLVTGGEDHKVNLWAIGKPNAILSLSGHSSGIDSVSFDSTEVFVAAGAASGTIKLWDLEEAKIVRTLTGHRSNCISLDFHPFGEFFASGSLDTNLKIWDIRRKGCIHTYKGHTRGVNAIRFTPDGRWVVSGGEDNTVKLWDLTAGKLLHEFKSHEGQIQCIDFHPHEFLLATGSADRTVKFWDLETFELIGSAGPETTGVRCMTFNPDGRTLLCGLHESLKVFSWEPIRSHDSVDVGWSRLSDLNIHEGKLLGCSYNQSCVGVWVVDISRVEPYAIGNTPRSNSIQGPKANISGSISVLTENTAKTSTGRLSVSQNSDSVMKETKSFGRLSVSQNSEPINKESKSFASTGTTPSTPQRVNPNVGPKSSTVGSTGIPTTAAPNVGSKTGAVSSSSIPAVTAPRRNLPKIQSAPNTSFFNKSDGVSIIVPRNSARVEQAAELRREGVSGKPTSLTMQSRPSAFRKYASTKDDTERASVSGQSETEVFATNGFSGSDKSTIPAVQTSSIGTSAVERNLKDSRSSVPPKFQMNSLTEQHSSYPHESYENRGHRVDRDASSMENQRGVRTRSIVANWEKKDRSSGHEGYSSSNPSGAVSSVNALPPNVEMEPANEEDTISALMEPHNQFVGSLQSRLAKLEMVHKYWERNDIKGAIGMTQKMSDNAVLADVVSILTEKPDIVTLDICTCVLPLLASLLESEMDWHQGVSLELLIKLVRVFGSVIYSSLSASSSVGVDIEAEQRLERCNLCFVELEKVKGCLPLLTRKGGTIAKSAHELIIALQEVS
ncbi:Katanin p80 WD40 repeat-containing subunit B1-like [Heracleum sosnowskyi]|uniref:Katanin p80 WD40 repeat-containing subunit B1 homolog n=1 Tax=Heracleum sosnowskyi TaxID=360622 RepID=A0AAD8I884_9APIA|nr:Katanin p80 WD40 repeat-containing subunit B1-like [Heracleum sosnowskyi]